MVAAGVVANGTDNGARLLDARRRGSYAAGHPIMSGRRGRPESPDRVSSMLTVLAALATLFVSVAFGIFASIQLLVPETGAGAPWLSWGRIRYAHTQGVILGWLGNVFFAFLYHAVPILSGRPSPAPRWDAGSSRSGISP